MPLLSDPVTVAPAPLVPASRSIATTAVPDNYRHPGARQHLARPHQRTYVVPQRRCSTPRHRQRTDLDCTWTDHPERRRLQGPRRLHRHRQADEQLLGFGINFTPLVPGAGGVDLSMPVSWNQGIRGNAATNFGGNKGTAAGAWDWARRSSRPTSSACPTSTISASTTPTCHRRGHRLQRQPGSDLRSRLGVAHLQDHLLRSPSMNSPRPGWRWPPPLPSPSLPAPPGGRSRPMRPSKLGTTLTPSAPRRPATRTHDSPLDGGMTTLPPSSRKAAASASTPTPTRSRACDHRQGPGGARRQADRSTKELLKRHRRCASTSTRRTVRRTSRPASSRTR